MTTLNASTIDKIKSTLRNSKLTTKQIVFVTGIPQMGVEACLSGMWRRNEVKRTVSRPGRQTKWWLHD